MKGGTCPGPSGSQAHFLALVLSWPTRSPGHLHLPPQRSSCKLCHLPSFIHLYFLSTCCVRGQDWGLTLNGPETARAAGEGTPTLWGPLPPSSFPLDPPHPRAVGCLAGSLNSYQGLTPAAVVSLISPQSSAVGVGGRCCFFPHFTEGDTEAGGGHLAVQIARLDVATWPHSSLSPSSWLPMAGPAPK